MSATPGSPGSPSARLEGSARAAVAGAQPAGPLDPRSRIEVTLVLRRRAPLPDPATARRALSAEELARVAGADPEDVQRVADLLRARGLEVLTDAATAQAQRRVRAAGPVGVLAELFGTRLELVRSPDPRTRATVTHRQRTGELSVPAELDGVVTAVLGLDDRPQATQRLRVAPAAAGATSYTPLQLATAYDFPGGDGAGQTVAIVELGGGFDQADLDRYFHSLGITGPQVRAVGVDGASNQPGGDPQGADGEVLLDIEVAGALVPAASVVVYFAPNTDAGFHDAVVTAAHADPTPTAISISWGQSEDAWTAQARDALDQAMADAAALGVTVCVAAGDDGSTDRATDSRPHVDFPAASPHALACGGTRLAFDPATGTVSSETVWDDPGHGATGGGVSDAFPRPSWQAGVGVPAGPDGPGRGVPDVAGDADPASGYQVLVDGNRQVIGGTSAVAPLWAALICRLAQALGGPLGLVQPRLYAAATAGHTSPGFRDITTGSNGAYDAGPGWDPCTGLGTPSGTALLAYLRSG